MSVAAEKLRPPMSSSGEEGKHVDNKEAEEMSPLYGAFIQVLQKSGNNISYVSYALPRGISGGMLDRMMTGILYPEHHFQGDVLPSRFSDPDLPLLHREGFHIDALDRLISVPRAVLDKEHQKRGSLSMTKYYDTQPKIREEMGAIKGQFLESLFQATPKAKVADGVHVYQGAYEYKDGDVVGLNLEGTTRFNLLDLPTDEGHKDQMNALVNLFRKHDTVTVVLADKTKTVADCAASCARFFEEKERLGQAADLSDIDDLGSFEKQFVAPSMYGGERGAICLKCEKSTKDCYCPED